MPDNNEEKNKNPFSPKGDGPKPNKNFTFIALIVLGLLFFIYIFSESSINDIKLPYSEFLILVEEENVEWKSITIIDQEIKGEVVLESSLYRDYKRYHRGPAKKVKGRPTLRFVTYSPIDHNNLVNKLEKVNKDKPENEKIIFNAEPKSSSIFATILTTVIPGLIIFGILWFFMFRQIQGTGNKALSFGKTRAKLVKNSQKSITFKDVAGVEEAKTELQETVEFLKEPEKFKKLGAKIPRGVLLMGPPGTGKTLLARSVAGEANRPFFNMSGSEFVEMFVGVGASRVRDLFEQGKKNAPCILFIDELDAVGRTRGAGYGGGHDEREQTLNQMLVEMDGFDSDETVIVMAATNRPDVLDPALLRPGRFDRRIVVSRPDIKGREAILGVHLQKILLTKSVDAHIIARGTPGFSGADLANLVNEAALIAARKSKKRVQMEDLEEAKDKVLMGPERRSLVLTEKEKITTAYHEAGHALLAYLLPNANSLHKVSIIPRGNALGITQTLPEDDRHTYSRQFCIEEIMILFGGRISEEYKFGKEAITNGASNDIERGTQIARQMVCEWGMSELLGPLSYGQKDEPIFIGKEIARHKDYSEQTAEVIDSEIKAIIDSCYGDAKKLIMDKVDKLELIAKHLIEKESLDKAGVESLLTDK